MDRKLCLGKKDKRLYKILYEAKDTICGDSVYGVILVIYHFIENNGLIFTMEKTRFDKEFIRLNIKGFI